jgi:hypothetical protein
MADLLLIIERSPEGIQEFNFRHSPRQPISSPDQPDGSAFVPIAPPLVFSKVQAETVLTNFLQPPFSLNASPIRHRSPDTSHKNSVTSHQATPSTVTALLPANLHPFRIFQKSVRRFTSGCRMAW